MEKWRCRGKNTNKVEINHGSFTQYPLSSSSPSSSLFASEKKGKRWSLGGLLKRISKNETPTASNIDILSSSNGPKYLDSRNIQSHHVRQSWSDSLTKIHNPPIKNDYQTKVIKSMPVSEHESHESSINFYNTSMHSRNSESSSETFRGNGGNNSRRNLIKARIKAKRERYCENSSSTDDEHNSNCSLALIQSEDNLQNVYRSDNNRRTRGARTERYMKRLCRDDSNGSNDNHEAIKNSVHNTEHPPLIKNKKKYSSDIASPHSWTANDNSRMQSHRKMPSYYYHIFNNKHSNMENVMSSKNTKCSIDLHDNESVYSDKCTRSLNRGCKITPITDNSNKSSQAHIYTPTLAHKVQPPAPPPRSSKSRFFSTPLHHSTQNSDVENGYLDVSTARYELFPHYSNVNCYSLDRIYAMPQNNFNYQSYYPKKITSRHSFNGESTFSLENNPKNYARVEKRQFSDDQDYIEAPIVPNIRKTRIPPPPPASIGSNNKLSITENNQEEFERKRHSKNLEEALQELEIIYNSLHLNNDEDLLDRAEKRSMDEYRDKIAAAAVEGSIKSSSDTTSSYEMSHELAWRNTTTFDQCHSNDTRLKDDMAYRRIHQNERSSSVDPNQMSQYSYLANSPILSRTDNRHLNNIFIFDKPKSRRGTPDLMRDDVVFRTINHANNTLKIIEPQPPFGIPLGPVTTAVESDYLHIEPTRNSPRSSYIPQSEPDVITDDLAFRNLRKDATKDRVNTSNTNFLPKIGQSPEMKKKRAVRSLSADLYGIINKSNDSQHAWYKEFVKLNRPSRLSDCEGDLSGNELNTNSWMSNREYFDLDINGNRPKSTYQGRIQVCIPHEDECIIKNESIELNETIDGENVDKQTSLSSPKIDDVPSLTVMKTTEPSNDNNELTEYKELCHNLESLINKISEKAKSVDTKSSDGESRKSSLENFVEWEDFFLKDDAESLDKEPDEPLNACIENQIGITQMVTEEKVAETNENDKVLCKLPDIHKELCDSPKKSLSLISIDSEELLKNKGNNVVIDKNTCTEMNSTNNVPYKLSDVTEVTNKSIETVKNDDLPKNTKDNNDSFSIDINEQIITVESDKTKDLMIFKSSSMSSLTNSTNNDDEKEHDDCIHESPLSEGEEFGNECIASSSLCQTSYKQIVNVCLLNTNSLSTYYVALWSVCLTLLIAIILAR